VVWRLGNADDGCHANVPKGQQRLLLGCSQRFPPCRGNHSGVPRQRRRAEPAMGASVAPSSRAWRFMEGAGLLRRLHVTHRSTHAPWSQRGAKARRLAFIPERGAGLEPQALGAVGRSQRGRPSLGVEVNQGSARFVRPMLGSGHGESAQPKAGSRLCLTGSGP
jgi:hypothetical protein